MLGNSNARGVSMIRLPSVKDLGLAKTARQAARVFVLSLALGAATHSSLGTPPLEQAKLGRVTCFLDEIHHPQAGKIADATVFIAAVWPDGTLASEGTGFVVSDSADGGAQGSRIVTAAHVIDDTDATRDGQRLAVFFPTACPSGFPAQSSGAQRTGFPSGGSIWSKTTSP